MDLVYGASPQNSTHFICLGIWWKRSSQGVLGICFIDTQLRWSLSIWDMKSVKGKVTCMWMMCCQTLYAVKTLSPLKGNFLQERFSQLRPSCSFKPWTGKSVLEIVITGNRNQTTRAWTEISLISTQKILLTFSTRNNRLFFSKCCQSLSAWKSVISFAFSVDS